MRTKSVNSVDGWSFAHLLLWLCLTAVFDVVWSLSWAVWCAIWAGLFWEVLDLWKVLAFRVKSRWLNRVFDRRGFSWLDLVFDGLGIGLYCLATLL